MSDLRSMEVVCEEGKKRGSVRGGEEKSERGEGGGRGEGERERWREGEGRERREERGERRRGQRWGERRRGSVMCGVSVSYRWSKVSP